MQVTEQVEDWSSLKRPVNGSGRSAAPEPSGHYHTVHSHEVARIGVRVNYMNET